MLIMGYPAGKINMPKQGMGRFQLSECVPTFSMTSNQVKTLKKRQIVHG